MRNKAISILIISLLLCMSVVQPAFAAYGNPVYGDPGGGDGGSGSPQQPKPEPTIITTDVRTEDDKALDEAIRETGVAAIDLSTQTDGKAQISPAIVDKLIQEEIPLVVQNEGVKVEFSGAALSNSLITNNLDNDKAVVEIGATVITDAEKQAVFSKAKVGASTGIFTVGSVIVNLTAQVTVDNQTSKIESFNEPVLVTIDLSGVNLTQEDIGKLCGTRLEIDANGNYVAVNLGGTYDPLTKTFSFYTTKFSLYTVMKVENLVNMVLQVGVPVYKLNGAIKPSDVSPQIINGRTMVPLRLIGEALGAEFKWNEKTRTVTIIKDGKTLTLVIDKTAPGLDVPATIRNGRTLVPVRYISESFGASVLWVPAKQTVEVVK